VLEGTGPEPGAEEIDDPAPIRMKQSL